MAKLLKGRLQFFCGETSIKKSLKSYEVFNCQMKQNFWLENAFLAVVWPPVDLHWFFEISIRTKKKSVRTEKKISNFITKFSSQLEMNAEMDISKNQGRSTGGKTCWRLKWMVPKWKFTAFQITNAPSHSADIWHSLGFSVRK